MHKRVDIMMPGKGICRGHATTEHPASSYGKPIILMEGIPYGPADLAMQGVRIVVRDEDVIQGLRDAGFTVEDAAIKSVSAKIPATLHAALVQKADGEGVSVASVIAGLLAEWIDRKEEIL